MYVSMEARNPSLYSLVTVLCLLGLLSGCARYEARLMETTAYCGCQECCDWQRGSWAFLRLDFWNRYISAGKNRGNEYTGMTASGLAPQEV